MKTIARRRRPALEPLEGRALLTAGALDTTFGGTGAVTTSVASFNLNGGDNEASGVAIQPDLKTVVAGLVSKNVPRTGYKNGVNENFDEVIRYNTDGSLDSTFGSGGVVTLPGSTQSGPSVYATGPVVVGLQSNGQIVVAGVVTVTQGTGKKQTTTVELTVYRLNPSGTLDTTFNGTGQVTLGYIPGSVYQASGLAIQADGKIVVGANQDANGGFVVARLNADGTRDTTFGPNGQGYADHAMSGATAFSNSVTLDASGNILVGGYDNNPAVGTTSPALVRYTPAGLSDATFGTNGEVLLPPPSASSTGGIDVEGIGLQSNGQIVVSGDFGVGQISTGSYFYAGVARLNSNGTLDTSFGSSGYFLDPTLVQPVGLTVQPDDKVLIAGKPSAAMPNAADALAVDRVTAAGQSDTFFGNGGQAQVGFSGSTGAETKAVTLGPDGKITVAGGAGFNVSSTSSVNRFAVARFLNDITSNTATASPALSPAVTSASVASATAPTLVPLALNAPDPWDAFRPLTRRRGAR